MIDDILFIASSEGQLLLRYFDQLGACETILLTIMKQEDGMLPFLKCAISLEKIMLGTSWYSEPHKNVIVYRYSAHPAMLKINVLGGMEMAR